MIEAPKNLKLVEAVLNYRNFGMSVISIGKRGKGFPLIKDNRCSPFRQKTASKEWNLENFAQCWQWFCDSDLSKTALFSLYYYSS